MLVYRKEIYYNFDLRIHFDKQSGTQSASGIIIHVDNYNETSLILVQKKNIVLILNN